MKKLLTLLYLTVFIFSSCEKNDEIFDSSIKDSGTKDKVDVCHNGHVINVSINALQAHLNHGDTIGDCSIEENYTYVPDDNFEQALIDLGLDDELDNLVLTSNIDTIITLVVDSKGIEDLTGIEDFASLNQLRCRSNSLTSIDLSQNSELTILQIARNQLTSLDLSNNPRLKFLTCGFNQISNLDVSQNRVLRRLIANSNSLVSLNVKNGNNSNFELFNTTSNPNLLCIEVDNEAYSNANWTLKDPWTAFSEDCGL